MKRSFLLIFVALLVPAAASAQGNTSVYTEFDSKKCRAAKLPKTDPEHAAWICPGHANMQVRLDVGDQRMTVRFGKVGPDDPVRSQTFPAFNDVYSGRVEWRLQAGRAFATILRWNVMTGNDVEKATGPSKPSGKVLVVTRLGPGPSCQVGYVDALANPDANELARKLADEKAAGFKCKGDKAVIVGKRTPTLAFPGD